MKSDSIEERLSEVADAVRKCKFVPDATFQYDVMSDALLWSDELPDIPSIGFAKLSILRVLLRYRTTMLLGEPENALKKYWEIGQRLFPSWPGFVPERSEACPERIRYLELHGGRSKQQ